MLFHPEVVHSEEGPKVLANFLDACGCRRDWNARSFVEEATERIREQVGPKGRVICALSGGVDSAVAALLVHRAIGDRLTCVFVDNGLLRKDEAQQVRSRFAQRLRLRVVTRRRVAPLPDEARRRERPRAEAQDHRPRVHRGLPGPRCARSGKADFLAQGTLYPDVIESDLGARPLGGDQEPPQRRRAAEVDEVQARRAAAVAVQGRGAQGRDRARPRRGVRLPPAVPRSRPGRAVPRAGDEGAARPAARGRRHLRRGDQGARASTARSGSPSPSSCPCARSA